MSSLDEVRAAYAEHALARAGSTSAEVLDAIRTAGYLTVLDLEDHVYRIREPQGMDGGTPRLVGLLVVRQHRIRYAEFRGQVFAWWGVAENSPEHRDSLWLLLDAISAWRRK